MSSASLGAPASAPFGIQARWAAALSFDDTRFGIYAVCAVLLILGTFWRFLDLAYPNAFTFDEHHFVSNARNYIAHQPDWNDHPPLGKLILIPGMLAFGDNGLGWRISSALLGLGVVIVAGLNARKLFGSAEVGLLTAAFLAVDGLFVAYARTALLDTPLTFFMYLALLCMLSGPSLWWFAAAGVSIGLAVATKWTGICILLLTPWLLIRSRRSVFHAAWMLALAFGVYAGIWAFAQALTNQAFSWTGMFTSNAALLKHHAGFTVWDNAASSRWYTWPLLTKPIVMHFERITADALRAMSCVGNPVVWFATTAATGWALLEMIPGVGEKWKRVWAERHAAGTDAQGLSLCLAGMLALQLPFILTDRQSYIWHYMGAYGLGMAALAHALTKVSVRRPGWVLGFLVVAAGVALVYAPLWTNAVLSPAAYDARLPFAGWR